MKTKYLFGIAVAALGLAACENHFDKTYMDNGNPQISEVKTYDYTLTEADYATIAANKTNKTYAQSLDTIEGETTNQDALALVGENLYFNETASADMYVPAFIYSKYPHLDPGSTFNVTYKTWDGLPAYLDKFNMTIRHTLTAADYTDITGGDQFLTDATLVDIWKALPQVDDNYLCGAVYNYQNADGSIQQVEKLFIFADGVDWVAYEHKDCPMHVLPAEANGKALQWVNNNYPYAIKDDKVVIMEYDTDTEFYVATEFNHNGIEWVENTGILEETMSFVLSEGWAANLSTYYRQAVAGDGNQGKLVIQDFDLQDGISYIWTFTNNYGMKGTAYYGGPHYGEGWVVTPYFKLKKSKEPALSFDHALNYAPADSSRYTQVTVWVSTDYVDDVRTATWTQLPWNKFDPETNTGIPENNSWTFYNSGRMDLSAWNDQRICIGFRYKSEPGQTCSTWEFKNILVNEPEEEEESETTE